MECLPLCIIQCSNRWDMAHHLGCNQHLLWVEKEVLLQYLLLHLLHQDPFLVEIEGLEVRQAEAVRHLHRLHQDLLLVEVQEKQAEAPRLLMAAAILGDLVGLGLRLNRADYFLLLLKDWFRVLVEEWMMLFPLLLKDKSLS